MQSLHTFGVSVIGHLCFYKNAHVRNNMSILVDFSVNLLLEICELNNGVKTLFLGYLANLLFNNNVKVVIFIDIFIYIYYSIGDNIFTNKEIAMVSDLENVKKLVEMMIPISRFNKGEAGKIFEELKKEGIKIVVKNNKPACVLLSPETYNRFLEIVEEHELLLKAQKRNEDTSIKDYISHEEMKQECCVCEKDPKSNTLL